MRKFVKDYANYIKVVLFNDSPYREDLNKKVDEILSHPYEYEVEIIEELTELAKKEAAL